MAEETDVSTAEKPKPFVRFVKRDKPVKAPFKMQHFINITWIVYLLVTSACIAANVNRISILMNQAGAVVVANLIYLAFYLVTTECAYERDLRAYRFDMDKCSVPSKKWIKYLKFLTDATRTETIDWTFNIVLTSYAPEFGVHKLWFTYHLLYREAVALTLKNYTSLNSPFPVVSIAPELDHTQIGQIMAAIQSVNKKK